MIDQKNAIRNLQEYLRGISYYDKDIPPVPIDGIYDSATKNAVKAYQRKYGLTPNGIVEKKTWDSIYRTYKRHRADYAAPLGIFPYPNMPPDFLIYENESSDLVMIIQIMLNTLRIGYDDLGDFSVNGTLDKESMYAIKEFQRLNFLPQTGLVDAATWNSLAAGYNKYIKVN